MHVETVALFTKKECPINVDELLLVVMLSREESFEKLRPPSAISNLTVELFNLILSLN